MTSDVESMIAGFIDRFSPEIQGQLCDARTRLRAWFPRGFELVFDNTNALVVGYAPSERSSESFVSIAAYPRWVTLFFLNGKDLDDPEGLLQGDGKQIRSIRLASPSDLDASAVRGLIAQAIGSRRDALAAAPPLATVIKMVAAVQRPRRPVKKG